MVKEETWKQETKQTIVITFFPLLLLLLENEAKMRAREEFASDSLFFRINFIVF